MSDITSDVRAEPNDTDVCGTCEQSWGWHKENRPLHAYRAVGADGRLVIGPPVNGPQQPSQTPAWPMDPVLRQALIDKGVLTPADLDAAKAKITAITGEFTQAMRHGQ